MPRPLDHILDELLVLKCQDGDVEAFNTLVSRWHVRLRRHAWYLTDDWEAAGDVVQDAWLDITRAIRRLKDPASFRGWAYRIVGNKATDWLRRTTRQRAIASEVARQAENMGERTSRNEEENRSPSSVRQAIRGLPSGSQQILSMKYLDQMSIREIAEALDVPTGTVKSRLYHAREQLKHVLVVSPL